MEQSSLSDPKMKILIVGDLQIPDRSRVIPHRCMDIFVSEKPDQILCTGNLTTRDALEQLEKICSNIVVTQGESDNDHEFPDIETLQLCNFSFTMFHGNNIIPPNNVCQLKLLALQYDSEIIVYGSTHKLNVIIEDNKLYINPGSLTGAFHPPLKLVNPSFVMMKIFEDHVAAESYELQMDQSFVSKTYQLYRKTEAQTVNGNAI